jgi:hypothetical protein
MGTMRRVSEEMVSRVLWTIHAPPNSRREPLTGDMAGEYDFWFDGGACRVVTGCTYYYFRDGTTAFVSVVPRLAVRIAFATGETVDISQQDGERL